MRLPVLFPVLLLLMTAQAPAQMPENYVIDTTADLIALCSVDPADPEYVAAIHFCHGYGAGAVQYHFIQVQAMPQLRMFCLPDPPPTRAEATRATSTAKRSMRSSPSWTKPIRVPDPTGPGRHTGKDTGHGT